MSAIATVDPKLLALLNPEEAVDLFRDLLWAESWRQGINLLDVSVPSNITAADGGVDAEVSGAPASEGLIKMGLTRYQIKTGDFSATQDAKARELLFKEGTTELKERVGHCFAQGGTFVIVLFGSDNPNTTEDDTTIKKCTELLQKHHPAILVPKIGVLRANKIAGLLSLHVGLSLRAQRMPNAPFRTHQEWSSQSDMRAPMQYGDAQQGICAQLGQELRNRTSAIHVCLTGEPGVGKTRMVLEATRAPDLAPLVIYCASPQHCTRGGVVDLLIHEAQRHAIVIVDDADVHDAQALWNELEHRGARVKLVTLQHETPRMGGSTVVLAVPPLDEAQVFAILQQYVPGNQSRGFVGLCSGSPRVAHVIGANLRRFPNDLLQAPDTVDVWGRYISGTDDPNSDLVQQRHTLLRYCALFRKFGSRKPVVHELQAIIGLVQKDHPEISNGKIVAALDDLRGRRIIQGETTLYITPKALHIKLWSEWWELYGPLLDFGAFVQALPETLRAWFYEMFRYAKASGVATRIVDQLLGPDDPFVKTSLLNSASGAEVFRVLAEADPARALSCLEATIANEPLETLQANTAARRQLVWSLEGMAMWGALFTRAARLLARLALAENEPRIANNATGVFCDLFSLGPGDVAPTEAPPEERFALLQAMLAEKNSAARLLAIRACGTAFNFGHFARSSSAEFQGLHVPPQRWRPKTYGEWFAAYEQVWGLLRAALPTIPPDEQAEAAKHFLEHAYDLGRIERLGPLVLATLNEVAGLGMAKRELTERVEYVVDHLEDFPEHDRAGWAALLEDLHGGADFGGRLHRFVGRTMWRVDQTTEEAFVQLAREAQADPGLLDAALPWLLSNDAQSTHAFGYHLGKIDEHATLWGRLFEGVAAAMPKDNIGLLGGYLRATKERDEQRWHEQLSVCAADDRIAPVLYQLIFQAGLTDAAGKLLASVIRESRSPALVLRQFSVGSEIRNLSDNTFLDWRALLRQGGVSEMQALIELMDAYYTRAKPARPVPLPETVEILTDERLFAPVAARGQMLTDYSWRELAIAAAAQDAAHIPSLAHVVIDHVGVASSVLQQFGETGATKWLREVADAQPVLVWRLIKDRLGPPIDRRAFHLKDWMDDSRLFDERKPNLLDRVPREELWDWVEADVEQRAWYLAHLVAPLLAPGSLARDVLIRYGEREDVRSNLRANFDTEGWSGPASSHHEGKRLAMESLLADETEAIVRRWITEYIEQLKVRIEHEKVEEEREF